MEKQQRVPGQAVRQRVPQQNMRQARMPRHKKSTVKILLWIILAVQLICAIELFMLLRALAADTENGQDMQTAAQGEFLDEDSAAGREADGTRQDSRSEAGMQVNGQGDEVESGDWKLTLVNKWNALEEGYEPELTELADGHMIDARIADSLMDMIHDAGDAGYDIYIISAYRDMYKQTTLYEAEVVEWLELGYSRSGAEAKAGTVVAVPGTSEHQLGLAVDLVSGEYVQLDEGAERTKGYKWLVKHCHEYGFILRYPNGKTDITGIIYEPWHFRYVGEEAATEIMEQGLTLEEYLEQL